MAKLDDYFDTLDEKAKRSLVKSALVAAFKERIGRSSKRFEKILQAEVRAAAKRAAASGIENLAHSSSFYHNSLDGLVREAVEKQAAKIAEEIVKRQVAGLKVILPNIEDEEDEDE